jgi:hypothetical protein
MDETEDSGDQSQENSRPMRAVDDAGEDSEGNEEENGDNGAADPPGTCDFGIVLHEPLSKIVGVKRG